MNDQQTSHADIYWRVWVGTVALAFVVRFAVLFFVNNASHPSFGVIYALGTWLPVMVLNKIEWRRLMSYLKNNHPQKWDDLCPLTRSGLRWRSSSRSRAWLYSSDDSADPTLAAMKLEYQDFIQLMLTVFFSYLVIVPLLSL